MRYVLIILIILSIYLSACSTQTKQVYDLDSARQIAVNRVMTDDNYVQNDGYDLKEIEAKSLDCKNCYEFTYEYMIISEFSSFNAYSVNVIMQNNVVKSVIFSRIVKQPSELSPIADRFDKYCDNKCGDGICNDVVCQDVDCICEESRDNCPEDC